MLSSTTLVNTLPKNVDSAKSNKTYYNKKEILSDTHWKSMNVFIDAPSHLSIISQGKFDEKMYKKYDKNYYYPASAGKGIDVYMIDNSFNFTYDEFSEINAKVVAVIENGKITKPQSDKSHLNKVCLNSFVFNHGSLTSMAVAGKTLGVARKVNLYGVHIVLEEKREDNTGALLDSIIAWLEYFKENNLVNPHKTVFNISLCNFTSLDEFENGEKYRKAQNLINEISDMGVVMVAGAGNNGYQVYDEKNNKVFYPCAFDNVISVGGAGKFNIPGIKNDEIDSSYYTLGKHSKNILSNYGSHVDIYTPFAYHYHGESLRSQESKNDITKNIDLILPGTSFSSPIVAGVAATLMSEYPEKKFTSKSMLEYLTEIGIKDIIQGVSEGCSNVFINNGKKIVYDANTEIEFDDSIPYKN